MVTLLQELDRCYGDVWENSNDCACHKKNEENDRVYMFLANLNRNLDEVRGKILGQKPLPSIREVFSKVRCKETRRRIMLQNQGFNSKVDKQKKPWYEHYKKPWHIKETC